MSANRITAKGLSPPKILDQNDDVSSFSCGVKDMDEFIQKEALDFQKERLGVTYLFLHDRELVGFATLSMADLKREKMEAKHRPLSKVENYPATASAAWRQGSVSDERCSEEIPSDEKDVFFSENNR